MRVLVVSTSFPQSADDPSGHFVRAEAERQVALGHEVHVVAPSLRFEAEPVRSAGMVVHGAGGGALFGWPGAVARLERAPWRITEAAAFQRGARRHLRTLGRFDLTEAHWLVPTAWPVLGPVHGALELFAHGADVRLLLGLPSPWRRRLVARWLAAGAKLHFASHSLRDALLGAVPVSLGSELERASDVRAPLLRLPLPSTLRPLGRRALRELGLRPDRPLVVTASRLVRSKRIELGARAMARLGPDVQWLVVGDGPALDEVARACCAARLDVRLGGRRAHLETLALIASADALLHPSAREGAPTVVREARALGVPVVACPVGDLPRWAAEDPGIQLVAADPQPLAEALRRALPRPREAPMVPWARHDDG